MIYLNSISFQYLESNLSLQSPCYFIFYSTSMKASLMVSKGVSSRAEFETNVTVISRMFYMTRLNVFI